MTFTATQKNDHDSNSSRSTAAINVARKLREVFQNNSLDVISSLDDVFGVLDWSSHNCVNGDALKLVHEELKEWGYDMPVVALPGVKGANKVVLKSRSEFIVHFNPA